MASMDQEDERTTAVGLFHFAEAYRTCAEALMRKPPRSLRFEDPMWLLAFHSLELYLKAYLRHHGVTPKKLRLEYRHRMVKLWDEAAAFGLTCQLDPRPMLDVMDKGELLSLRYILTGSSWRPDAEQLMQFLEQLRHEVFSHLQGAGLPVRLEDAEANGWPRE